MKNKLYKSIPLRLSDQAGFDENTVPKEIQVLRAGKYYHNGREITVTPEHLKKMIVNFEEKRRGVDLMVDFGHDTEGEAAAWFDNVYLTEDGTELWAGVIWTESGKQAVIDKKYRYISADFDFNYVDNETLTEYGPTLFGAGLTNRPVVKRMQPVIQLSEKNAENKENKMELEQKVDALADMLKSLIEKLEPKEELKEELKEEPKKEETGNKEDDEKKEQLSEIAKLKKENEDLVKTNQFNQLFAENKVVEAQREAFMKGDMVAFSENAVKLNTNDKGTINKDETPKDAEAEIIKLAEKMCTEEKIDYGKAVSIVLANNPKLSEEYNKKFEL